MDPTRRGTGQARTYPGKNGLGPTKNPTQAAEKTREDVNRYLKWAYSEAANVIARYHQIPPYGELIPESERERGIRKQ